MIKTDSLYVEESNTLINPFEDVDKNYKRKESDTWRYVDEWVPDESDKIFKNIVGAIIAPVCSYYKKQVDENSSQFDQSLDYFATSTKKCYNSDSMRFHTCHYLNYFEKFYDKDKEYLSILCQIKFLIDNSAIVDPVTGNKVIFPMEAFMYDLNRYILSPSLVRKTGQMARENYSLDLNYKNSNNPSLQYNDNHACLLMQCSILMNMMIPLLTHYFYMNKITMKIDEFLLKAFDTIFGLFPEVDLYNKLYETSSTNIGKNEQANAIIWNKQDIRGRNTTTHAISSVNNIILNIMPKYIFKQNIISMNYSSIMKNTGFQITDIGFEFSFIPLSSSKRDDDDISEFDKYESNLIKQDESKFIASKVNCSQTMRDIESRFGPFTQEELDYYINHYDNENWMNNLQKQLIFLLFYKYFGDSESIKGINKEDYFRLMIASKKILLNNNMIMLPYIISSKIEKSVGRKILNKKEFLKLERSENYPKIIEKYKLEKTIKIILGYIASIISSEFRIIDMNNPNLDGKMINIVPDIVIEEMLMFALMI